MKCAFAVRFFHSLHCPFPLRRVSLIIQLFTIGVDSELEIDLRAVRIAVRLDFVEILSSRHDRVRPFVPQFKQKPGSSLSIAGMSIFLCTETSPFGTSL
jgi:hypothetical protein